MNHRELWLQGKASLDLVLEATSHKKAALLSTLSSCLSLHAHFFKILEKLEKKYDVRNYQAERFNYIGKMGVEFVVGWNKKGL